MALYVRERFDCTVVMRLRVSGKDKGDGKQRRCCKGCLLLMAPPGC